MIWRRHRDRVRTRALYISVARESQRRLPDGHAVGVVGVVGSPTVGGNEYRPMMVLVRCSVMGTFLIFLHGFRDNCLGYQICRECKAVGCNRNSTMKDRGEFCSLPTTAAPALLWVFARTRGRRICMGGARASLAWGTIDDGRSEAACGAMASGFLRRPRARWGSALEGEPIGSEISTSASHGEDFGDTGQGNHGGDGWLLERRLRRCAESNWSSNR